MDDDTVRHTRRCEPLPSRNERAPERGACMMANGGGGVKGAPAA